MKVAVLAVAGLALVLIVGTRQNTTASKPATQVPAPVPVPEKATAPNQVRQLLNKVTETRKRIEAPPQIQLANDVIGRPMTPYEHGEHVELVSTWVQFQSEAHLSDQQSDQVMRIVWDVQEDLRLASEESWKDFRENGDHDRFTEFERGKHATLQTDLDARVRAVLTPDQAERYQDGETLSVLAIDLYGPLVQPRL